MSIGRRDMLIAALLGSASGGVPPAIAAADPRAMPDGMNMDEPKPQRPATPRLPAILCRTADTIGIAAAYRALLQGADTLDAALSNAAQQALHGINRGGPGHLEQVARTCPRQYVAIGTLEQIAALVAETLRRRKAM